MQSVSDLILFGALPALPSRIIPMLGIASHGLWMLFGTYVFMFSQQTATAVFFIFGIFRTKIHIQPEAWLTTDRIQRQTQIDKPVQATPAVCLFLVRLSLGRGDRISQVAQAAGHGVAPAGPHCGWSAWLLFALRVLRSSQRPGRSSLGLPKLLLTCDHGPVRVQAPLGPGVSKARTEINLKFALAWACDSLRQHGGPRTELQRHPETRRTSVDICRPSCVRVLARPGPGAPARGQQKDSVEGPGHATAGGRPVACNLKCNDN